MNDKANGNDQPTEAERAAKFEQVISAMFGARPVDATTLTTELLTNTISAIMATMGSQNIPTEKLIDALIHSSASHVAAGLVSLELGGRFKQDATVETAAKDIANQFTDEIVIRYKETKAEAEAEGLFDKEKEGKEDGE